MGGLQQTVPSMGMRQLSRAPACQWQQGEVHHSTARRMLHQVGVRPPPSMSLHVVKGTSSTDVLK